jgi:hypothetical protein
VRRRLVGQDVGREATLHELRDHVGGVAQQRNRPPALLAPPGLDPVDGDVQRIGRFVHVAGLQTAFDPVRVHFDDQRGGAVHDRRERLGPAHPAKAGRDEDAPVEVGAELPPADRRERLERALQDALGADVDPAACRHLAVHRQAPVLEVAERLPGRPRGHQHGVGDEHPRGAGVRAEDADRLAGLDEQRLVVLERAQRSNDGVVAGPVARGLSRPAVDDQVVRAFGDLGVEVVHQHAQGGLLRPALAGHRGASRRPNVVGDRGHGGFVGLRCPETRPRTYEP